MKDIAIFGAGGYGRETACMIRYINDVKPTWNLIGYFVENVPIGTQTEYGSVLGGISELNSWPTELSLVIAIGEPEPVQRIANEITNDKIEFPNLIAPNVFISDMDSLHLGKGNLICQGCYLGCNATIGDFNSINYNTIIGHDAIIGSYNSIMPNVNVSGKVKIGNTNFLGVQAVILQKMEIGNHTRIGANSVVMWHTEDGHTYIGNPATKTF